MLRHFYIRYWGVLIMSISVLSLVNCEGGGSNEGGPQKTEEISALKTDSPTTTAAADPGSDSGAAQGTFDASLTIDLTGMPSTSGDQASHSILGHGDFEMGDTPAEVYCIILSGMDGGRIKYEEKPASELGMYVKRISENVYELSYNTQDPKTSGILGVTFRGSHNFSFVFVPGETTRIDASNKSAEEAKLNESYTQLEKLNNMLGNMSPETAKEVMQQAMPYARKQELSQDKKGNEFYGNAISSLMHGEYKDIPGAKEAIAAIQKARPQPQAPSEVQSSGAGSTYPSAPTERMVELNLESVLLTATSADVASPGVQKKGSQESNTASSGPSVFRYPPRFPGKCDPALGRDMPVFYDKNGNDKLEYSIGPLPARIGVTEGPEVTRPTSDRKNTETGKVAIWRHPDGSLVEGNVLCKCGTQVCCIGGACFYTQWDSEPPGLIK